MRLRFCSWALLFLPANAALLGLVVSPVPGQQPERAWTKAKVFTNSIGMKLAMIPAGTFNMGSPASEKGHTPEELLHKVTLTQPFHMGVSEVTQEQFEKIMGYNPSKVKTGRNYPVEFVTWLQAKEFCAKLSALPQETKAGRVYRLPTEAQWEYACRAGTTTAYHCGATIDASKANFNSRTTTPVGSYAPNAWGLYDMHGNVSEWCADSFSGGWDYYRISREMDPPGSPDTGRRDELMAVRGGCCIGIEEFVRSAVRSQNQRDFLMAPHLPIGFRVICVPAPNEEAKSSLPLAAPKKRPGPIARVLILRGYTLPLMTVAFTPDSQHLIGVSGAYLKGMGAVKVWDAQTGREERSFPMKTDYFLQVVVSPEGKRLGSGSYDGTARIWNLENTKETLRLTGTVKLSVAFSPDGQRFAASTHRDGIVVVDANSGRTNMACSGGGRRLAFSPDGQWLASCGSGRGVPVWNAHTGKKIAELQGGGLADGLAFSPDGKRLAAATWGGTVVWDVATKKQIHVLKNRGPTLCAAFSPDGKWLAAAGNGSEVLLWDAASGQRVRQWQADTTKVHCLAFSPDSQQLAAGLDQTIAVWAVDARK